MASGTAPIISKVRHSSFCGKTLKPTFTSAFLFYGLVNVIVLPCAFEHVQWC